jgi:imidazolonepropionase-like amidohydrolase
MTTYRMRAVLLPDGRDPVEVWSVDGRLTSRPQEAATDLPGEYLSAGLVDAHVHLSLDFAATGLPLGSAELMAQNLDRHARAGVLALRDAGYVQHLRLDGIDLPPSPRVLRSGWLTTPEGRFFPTSRSGGLTIAKHTAPDELLTRVDEVAAAGLPWCKIIADFPAPDGDLFAAPANYPLDTVRAAVERAHAVGLRVMVHSTGPFVAELVRAGVDAVEHGMSVTPETVRAMADHGTCWVPTMATVEAHLRAAEQGGAPPDARLSWSARTAECLGLALELGVPVLVGSDELPHGGIVEEMLVMQRHGMTARQVLVAASGLARSVLELPGLDEGDPADVVLYDADPREDLRAVARPRAVLAGGRLVGLDAG